MFSVFMTLYKVTQTTEVPMHFLVSILLVTEADKEGVRMQGNED